ncbi:MAG: hypothetical protein J6T34_01290 [Bacilli bacterium]|nr:hypothetical protein [Bacilli bacterium]
MAASDSRVINLGDLSRFKDNMDNLLANKMDEQDPAGTGSFSMNRLSGTTVGNNSTTLGNNNEASGANSFAAGESSRATNSNSIALGKTALATGSAALAEGLGTKASSNNQHVQGKYNIEDNNNIYADIIGNGTADNARSNAATVDWNGNAWFAGDVSTGNPAIKLAKEKELKLGTDNWNNLVDKNNTILTVNRVLSSALPSSFANNTLNFSDNGKIYLVDNAGTVVTYSDYNSIELVDLTDIDLSSLANGDILVYNATTHKWENQTYPDTKDNISDLDDVNISNVANDEVLKYDSVSGKWKNGTITLPTAGHIVKDDTNSYTQRTGLQFLGLNVSDDNTNQNTVITANVSSLNDTNISNPANGQVLKYNASTNKWENANDIGSIEGHNIKDENGTILEHKDNLQFEGAIVANDNINNVTKVNVSINSLTDTNISNALADGYTLVYDATSDKWVDINNTLNNLNNVNISSLTDGQIIKYNATSGKWENANDTGIDNLVDLNDVNTISLADGQILKYDSSTHKWVNATLPTQVNSDWNAIGGPAEILNKPTIPAAQVNSDWNASSGLAEILNKPTLGTAAAKDVAVSGDASSTEVVMGNDSRLSDSRPASDVSAWAKAANKPTYDYSEITNTPSVPSALADLSSDTTHRTVTDAEKTLWNDKCKVVKISQADYNNLTYEEIHDPTKMYAIYDASSGGGSVAWGDITGTLANQTDLVAALNSVKADVINYVNTNILGGLA